MLSKTQKFWFKIKHAESTKQSVNNKKKTTNSYADKVAAVKMDSLNEFSGPFQLVTLWKYCIRHKRLLHKIQQLPCKEANSVSKI